MRTARAPGTDLISEGDKVVARVNVSGTHEGPFMEVPASQRRVAFAGADVFRIQDGKIAERWNLRDLLGLMRQIGGLSAG